MAKTYKANFSAEGVSVKVPQQAQKIRAKKLPQFSLDQMKGVPGGFNPWRVVINFALYEEGKPDVFLTEFSQPFELRVRYTNQDEKRASKEGKQLSLAFWDGGQWIRFTKEKHQFSLQPDFTPNTGGYGVVKISRWGDPHVAWGD